MTKIPELKDLPQPPEDSVFSLTEVRTVVIPHPYMVGTAHVVWAADMWSGRLSRECILDAEKRGKARCEICKGKLGYDAHESQVTLFISVPQNDNLNAIPGLHSYLYENKERFIQLGIQGFAFPPKLPPDAASKLELEFLP